MASRPAEEAQPASSGGNYVEGLLGTNRHHSLDYRGRREAVLSRVRRYGNGSTVGWASEFHAGTPSIEDYGWVHWPTRSGGSCFVCCDSGHRRGSDCPPVPRRSSVGNARLAHRLSAGEQSHRTGGGGGPLPRVLSNSSFGELLDACPGPPRKWQLERLLGPGGKLYVDYRFQVDHFNASIDDGLVVRVPQSLALFPAAPLNLTVIAPATVFTVNSPGYSSAPFGLSYTQVTEAETFSGSATAIFTSQLIAVTTSLPWNSVTLAFQWNWTFVNSSGPPTGSNFGGGRNVTPDQYVQLASTSRLSMSNGNSFTACVSGSVEGRTFSLHAETVNGTSVDDFVQLNATVPLVTNLPFCWSVLITLPSKTPPPQTLLVHVWDYQNAYTSNVTTLLLYSLSVKVVSATSTPSNDILGYPVSTWLTFTTIGVTALAVALVGYGLLRSRRRRKVPPQLGAPDSSVAPVAGPASESPAESGDGRPGRRNQ